MTLMTLVGLTASVVATAGCKEKAMEHNGLDAGATEAMAPFIETEVSFGNQAAGVSLSGTLSVPGDGGRRAAVVLLSGSGPMDRDSAHLGLTPFKTVAEYMAGRGVVVLRYDKRGVGKSTGEFQSATTVDFAEDALEAVRFLGKRNEVRPEAIGIVGHSEGGLIAAMAANRSDSVAFIVMLAGPALPIRRNGALFFSLLVNEGSGRRAVLEEDLRELSWFFDIATLDRRTPEQEEGCVRIARRLLPRISDRSRAALGLTNVPPEVFVSIFSTVPCVKGFLEIDPDAYYSELSCPMLAVYGQKDVQVPAQQNMAALDRVLARNPGADHTVVEMPGVNHLFQRCGTGYPSEYESAGPAMAAEVLQLVRTWIASKIEAR